jgi:putative FmdB family regulatory protein
MPIYEYQCKNPLCTRVFERVCRISEHTPEIQCPICGDVAPQLPPRVAVHDDHPKWLDDNVRTQIQGDDNVAPIETRGEYERYCKEHGIIVTDKRV